MEPIVFIDRLTGKREIENVYGEAALRFLYGDDAVSKILGAPLIRELVKHPFFSAMYGWWQRQPITARKIKPFVERFNVDASEFQKNLSQFESFNDFFIRKLKPSARPIAQGEKLAVIPADGRYRFFPNIDLADGYLIKGQKFDLTALLEDSKLAARYAKGTMVMARLCPTDYHRYHFPCDCIPAPTRIINGWLYPVNPFVVEKNIHIYTENKRALCQLESEQFGKVLFLEIGATNVGSINQTYFPFHPYFKGDEKGFFAFGGSALIVLFEPGRIVLDADLIAATQQQLEIRCLMGQSMGRSLVSV